MKKVFLSTLGCKVNQFETAAFKSELEKYGTALTADLADADLIIINTCTVTGKAGRESRREVARAARLNGQAQIVVTGCHAQLAAAELRRLPDIDSRRLHIVGNDGKDRLVSNLLGKNPTTADKRLFNSENNAGINRLSVKKFEGRTRAYLRVQDGCESFCSYCIVPYARGRSRSLPIDEVLDQTAQYVRSEHREIVVTGIHVGHYGLDLAEGHDISSLMARLCTDFAETRFRLSSIEPLEISDELLALIAERENFMPHLHIPLQSGDDDILKRMNRRYRASQFIEVITRCRASLADAAIGLDVLVGFPGETQEQFDNTRILLESVDLSYLHVFPYSRRPGTRAAEFADQVPQKVKQKRVEQLRLLSDEKKKAFYGRFIGSRRNALLETKTTNDTTLTGFTDNYIPVRVQHRGPKPAAPVSVEMDRLSETFVLAHIVTEP